MVVLFSNVPWFGFASNYFKPEIAILSNLRPIFRRRMMPRSIRQ
jgi:hypothetical protein